MHFCFPLMSILCTGAVFVNTSRVSFNPAIFLVLTLSMAHVWITAKEPFETACTVVSGCLWLLHNAKEYKYPEEEEEWYLHNDCKISSNCINDEIWKLLAVQADTKLVQQIQEMERNSGL